MTFAPTDSREQLLATQTNDPSFPNVLDELVWRGLVAVSTDLGALRARLEEGPLTYYCGFDPTAASLHLGNLVQLLTLRRLQLAGNRPIGVVGGATGLIGDPRPTAERTLHDKATVAGWVERIGTQVGRFLSTEGENPLRLVNNLDWTGRLSAIDLLRDVGKHFRVNTMLAKEAVSARLDSEAGISYTEFSYQVLQGLDFLELYRRYGCVLQTGGQDQWGNLTAGIDLIRHVEGVGAHAFGTPIITDATGHKFGKSEGNAVWLDPNLTSPYAFYQFWLNVDDRDVIKLLKVFTFLHRERIEALEQITRDAPQRREAQRALAWEVTSLVHGPAAAQAVVDASAALFGRGELGEVPIDTLVSAVRALPHVTGAPGDAVVPALVATGVVKSSSDARRAIAQGGVYVDNAKVEDPDAVLPAFIGGRVSVLRRGKKTLAGVVTESDETSLPRG